MGFLTINVPILVAYQQAEQPVNRLLDRSAKQALSHLVSHLASQSVSQPFSQSIGQSGIQSTHSPCKRQVARYFCCLFRVCISQPVSLQSASQPVKRSVSQSARQSVSQPVSRAIGQSASQPGNRSVSQSARQSISQPGNRSVSQSARQSVSQPVSQLTRRAEGRWPGVSVVSSGSALAAWAASPSSPAPAPETHGVHEAVTVRVEVCLESGRFSTGNPPTETRLVHLYLADNVDAFLPTPDRLFQGKKAATEWHYPS